MLDSLFRGKERRILPKAFMWMEDVGAGGSLKNYVPATPGNTGSHRVPNTSDLRLISSCICYQHHYYSSAVALTGEGTQAGTSF